MRTESGERIEPLSYDSLGGPVPPFFCRQTTKKSKKYAIIKKSCTFAAENEL